MRARIVIVSVAVAAVIAAAAITQAMRSPAATTHTRTTAARHIARPAGCPGVLRAVTDVARKANINLGTGSMTAHVVRNEELAWLAELLGSWKQSAKPTAADIQLGQDVLTASTGLPLRGNADARKFIASLQKLQADCA
jgi:hypothetical protein